jgi:hypothetical protein
MLRKKVSLLMLLLVSCAQGPDIWVPREVDFTPPRLVSCERDTTQSVVLSFDKPVDQLVVEPPKGEVSFTTTDQRVFLLSLSVQPEPGAEWVLRVHAADPLGNSSVFLVAIYGTNPRLPRVRLNELNIQGSTTKPDYIELLVQSDGNLAGLVVAMGAPAQGEAFYTFPSVEVKTGDYLILHTKPQGIAQEKDETKHKRESGGLLSSPTAWDFWWRGGKGLSGTTGMVVLLDNPRGKALDAVIYTNRTSTSDDRYGGWGSKAMKDKAYWLHTLKIWEASGEETLVPEDAVHSGYVTSTRTLNRKNTGLGKNAWFTGATGTASPGSVNTTQVHVP